MIANQISATSQSKEPSPFLDELEADEYQRHKHHATYLWIVFHELLGHGAGHMMTQEDDETYDFEIKSPPINPLTGRPTGSWYRPGQTWTGQFTDLATTVDECTAELVGAYLMDDRDILALFGYDDKSDIRPEDRSVTTLDYTDSIP
jgi:dipeptidyl-peptidase III